MHLILIGAATWGFLELQDEIREGDPIGFDDRVLLWFREADAVGELRGPEWLETTARDITALGSIPVLTLLTIAVGGLFLLRRQYRPLILTIVTVIGGAFLVDGLKAIYARSRPEIVPHLVAETSLSFPSGHSTMSTVVYLSLAVMFAEFQHRRRVRVYIVSCAGILAILIGVSRVMLGVHFPSDVAAGWTIGLIWASLGWLVAIWLKRRSKTGGDPDDGSDG